MFELPNRLPAALLVRIRMGGCWAGLLDLAGRELAVPRVRLAEESSLAFQLSTTSAIGGWGIFGMAQGENLILHNAFKHPYNLMVGDTFSLSIQKFDFLDEDGG